MKEKDFLAALDAATGVTVNGRNGDIAIQPAIAIRIPQNEIVRQYDEVTYCGQTQKIKGDKKLLKFLEEEGAYTDGEVDVKGIGDSKLTVEEYEARLAFDGLDMEGLLEKYLPLADSFSLTCAYGEYKVTDEVAAQALKKIREACYKSAEAQFLLAAEDERKKLPPFKTIYSDVEKEYKDYCKEHSALIDANGGYACFSDVFSGDVIYSSLSELWHTYNGVDFAGTCEYVLEKLKKCDNVRPLTEELETEENKCLRDSLIKTEVTFDWHCTRSCELSKVFYIKLNKDTVEWLKRFKTDYDLDVLEDLAFYNKGKLLFSSCTHEKFHSDLTEKN